MSDSIMGQDIGICIVFFGLLVVFVFDIVPIHTKNYAKAYIKSILFAQLSLSQDIYIQYIQIQICNKLFIFFETRNFV